MTVTTGPVSWITPATPPPEYLVALGRLVVAHVHLDHMLKMTIKSMLGITVEEALQALSRKGSPDLRKRIQKHSLAVLDDEAVTNRLMELLGRCRTASERRNYIAKSVYVRHMDGPRSGQIALHDPDNQTYSPPPSVEEVVGIADEIEALVREINHARLEGWLGQAISGIETPSVSDWR